MICKETTRRAAFKMARRHMNEAMLLMKYATACKDAKDVQGVYDFSKAFCDHLEAYHRYNMMCADCGAGVTVAGNLGYHFQVVENVSKNVIKKNLA